MGNINKTEVVNITLLRCPSCGGEKLDEFDTNIVCASCSVSYRKDSGKIFFTEDFFDVDNWESESSDFDILQRGSSNYRKIDKLGGPRIRDLKSYLNIDGVALNLGGGADCYEGFISIDLGRYPNVHIVSNLENIPYKESSVDLVVSNSVFEHIENYESVINEIYRVLKPGGYLYLSVPNLCMRHHKYDYYRWTMPGLIAILNKFEVVESGSCRGVAYALDTLVEALIAFKTRPGFIRELLRKTWLFLSGTLYWIKGDDSPEYEAMSQTIYAIVKKQ